MGVLANGFVVSPSTPMAPRQGMYAQYVWYVWKLRLSLPPRPVPRFDRQREGILGISVASVVSFFSQQLGR